MTEPAEPPPARRAFPRRARRFLHDHRVPLLATGATLPLYLVWVFFLASGGGDLAAQETWARFAVEHGGSAYGLFWYGGIHTANYSLLSPYLMGALGVRTVGVVSGLAACWPAAVLCVRSGIRHPVAPALLAALGLWCNVAAGRTTFALGLAFALAACVLLTGERHVLCAAVSAALATMASPVAGLFLVVLGAAYGLVRDWARAAALTGPPFAVVAATALLFPFDGEQPMSAGRICGPALLGVAVTVLAPRGWRVLRRAGAVYATGTVLTYLVASPIGSNVERLALLFAPAVLLAALLAAPRPPGRRRRGPALALAASLAWLGISTVTDLLETTRAPAWADDTHSVVRALERLGADRTRVEVVPASNHREAAALAPHLNLARGWNRQLDVERGRLFYDGTLSEATYRAWLENWAVDFVVLPSARPERHSEAEARLVRSRPDWLEPVWSNDHWRVYRVRDAVPLVSPPGTVTRTTSAELDVRMPEPGSVTVRVAYSPWLHTDGGCLRRQGEFTRLTVRRPGLYRIGSGYLARRNSSAGEGC